MDWLTLRLQRVSPLSVAWWLIAVAVIVTNSAAAQNFRIATRVYVGDDEKPISEATTLFLDGVVYDFLGPQAQTAVFRMPSGDRPGRFILLDGMHRIRTEISSEKLSGAIDKLRTWASRQDDPMLRHASDPKFQESFEPESGRLILASHFEEYTVTTEPAEHVEILPEYREFLDWYARLNTLLYGGAPPGPRLRLNETLVRYRVLPLVVELKRSGENEPLRAEHDFTWRLSRDDTARIEEVRVQLASFRELTNEEYLRETQTASQD